MRFYRLTLKKSAQRRITPFVRASPFLAKPRPVKKAAKTLAKAAKAKKTSKKTAKREENQIISRT
jgi:hypothetical protein